MRSSHDVHDDLVERGIPHEIVRLSSSSRTASLAADALGVDVSRVVKTLLFMIDDARAVVALVSGDTTVDTPALARAAGGAELRLAKAGEVREVTGYPPGAVPPCALATAVPVVADPRVFVPDVVFCGGGTTTSMLRIRSADLAAVTAPTVVSIAGRPSRPGVTDRERRAVLGDVSDG